MELPGLTSGCRFPAPDGARGALCLRRRRPQRAHHDRGREAGISPGLHYADRRQPQALLDGFHISHWHSTDAPENHALSQAIYRET